ncbi:hypothetical protein [Gloeothece verrucosa]|uniref:Uncharacterized protein n=1 Tax=Gloeothece verrucosa (strain PCC 7822) TaxID=497965 RepID=E0U6Q6_GLOV7|nr:hypothetical protein [Gloeothece verrucosa]ADN14815.1 conserved hypothetical protein [Gloeothece verrucosa PCC 7822]
MKYSFWGLIWASFWEIQTFWIGFLSLSLTILFSFLAGKTPIPLYWVLIFGTIALLLIATLVKAVNTAFKEYQNLKTFVIPRILATKKKSTATGLQIEFLLDASNLFANDMYVSFYYIDDYGYELFIGLGYILTIQSNGKIQALLEQPNLVYQEILEKLANNNSVIREKTVVKPSFTRNILTI